MTQRRAPALAPSLALSLALSLACQERLTQPGDCPELCPGGTPQVIEEVLQALPGLDSTFTGYVERDFSPTLLASAGVPAPIDTARAILIFGPVPDSTTVRDTLRAYVVDSVLLELGMRARDTAVDGLQFDLYRLPGNLDTTAIDYASTTPFFTPSGLIGTISVPDSLRGGTVQGILRGPDVARVALAPTDNDRLAIGVLPRAASATGARLGAADLVPGTFQLFITPVAPNVVGQQLEPRLEFDSYVTNYSTVVDPNLLSVGGTPSGRSFIRFAFPPHLRDSAAIVRATLELVPALPVRGLPNDPGSIEARGVPADVGAKSPQTDDRQIAPAFVLAAAGSSAPVELEVARFVRLWQGPLGLPPTLSVRVSPEAATFTEAQFGSSRAGVAPRLRIEYLRAFPFERP